ncbi:Protein of unknown function, partial [Gryllus bimaculatus]
AELLVNVCPLTYLSEDSEDPRILLVIYFHWTNSLCRAKAFGSPTKSNMGEERTALLGCVDEGGWRKACL